MKGVGVGGELENSQFSIWRKRKNASIIQSERKRRFRCRNRKAGAQFGIN